MKFRNILALLGKANTSESKDAHGHWDRLEQQDRCRYFASMYGLKYHPLRTRIGLTSDSCYDSETIDAIYWEFSECTKWFSYYCNKDETEGRIMRAMLAEMGWSKMSDKEKKECLKKFSESAQNYIKTIMTDPWDQAAIA